MGRKRNISKQKIVSVVVAGAILVTLGVGVYTVGSAFNDAPLDNNIVDLNETEAPNLAYKSEDETDEIIGQVAEETKVIEETEGAGLEGEGDVVAKNDRFVEGDEIAPGNEVDTATKADESATEKSGDGAVVNAPAIVDPAAAYKFSENSSLLWPVKGDIIMNYSMDSTILFKTLGVYRCNPAILIEAEYGANVGVAADGVVTNVSESEETGTTVSVAVGNDYVVTYGQMDGVVVKAGDKVTKGQLLGTVAEPTAYYVEEGTHIYFAVTKSGVPVDPTEFLAE